MIMSEHKWSTGEIDIWYLSDIRGLHWFPPPGKKFLLITLLAFKVGTFLKIILAFRCLTDPALQSFTFIFFHLFDRYSRSFFFLIFVFFLF